MAFEASYVLKTVSFNSGGAVAIAGLQNFSVGQGGEPVPHTTDAQQAVTAHFIDNIDGNVEVETTDASLLTNAAFQVGKVGVLTLVFQKREKGKGAISGQDKTVTCSQAMVGPWNADLPATGRSSWRIPFLCSDASGVNPFAYS